MSILKETLKDVVKDRDLLIGIIKGELNESNLLNSDFNFVCFNGQYFTYECIKNTLYVELNIKTNDVLFPTMTGIELLEANGIEVLFARHFHKKGDDTELLGESDIFSVYQYFESVI